MSRQLEYCCICDEPTGNVGKDEDSLYVEMQDGPEIGPLCRECYDKIMVPLKEVKKDVS